MKLLDKDILYIDNHIIVVIKKANLLTQPNNSEISLEEITKDWLKKKDNKKSVFLHAIHRLDKPVEGIVLFARSSKALSRLNEQVREKKIKRIYLAIVEGELEKKQGVLKNYLLKENYKTKVVNKSTNRAKLAILHYKVIKIKDGKTLVEIELETGRYHQIRAQLAYISHPIIGDDKYGSSVKLKKIKLYNVKIEFLHPVTKEKLSFDLTLELL